MFADLGKVVATLNFVGFACRALSSTGSSANCATSVNRDIRRDVVGVGIHQFDLIPEFVFCFVGRSNPTDEEFVVLNVQVLKLNAFVIGGRKHSLILLFQLIKSLLSPLLLFRFRSTTSKHF